jgi:hypothetical protein
MKTQLWTKEMANMEESLIEKIIILTRMFRCFFMGLSFPVSTNRPHSLKPSLATRGE